MNDDWSMIRARRVLEKLTAENERLREHVGASGIAYAEALRKRAEQAEARTRTLEAALRGMLICDDRCKRPQCVQARAALTEPTPPQEEPR